MDYECDENIAVLTKNVVNVTICTNSGGESIFKFYKKK